MPTKLNQLLSIEKSVKNRREDEYTKIYQSLGKQELLNGFSKTYQPKDEDGEKFPAENKKVQVRAQDALKEAKKALVEIFDVVAQKDATNCHAKADVVVDGKPLLKDVPAVHLLFLEKRLIDLATFVKKIPVLSQDENWKNNEALGLWETDPVETVKGRKVTEFQVVVQPTKEHPAQVKEVSRDVLAGTWKTVKFSGALKADQVKDLVERVEKVSKAVKYALEEANGTQAVEFKSGEVILGYIFG